MLVVSRHEIRKFSNNLSAQLCPLWGSTEDKEGHSDHWVISIIAADRTVVGRQLDFETIPSPMAQYVPRPLWQAIIAG